jgi:hypothetical protein
MPDAALQLHTLLLCDYALTAKDGKISAIGVFSQINVPQLPAVHGRLFVVAVLEAAPGPYPLLLQIVAPSGSDLLPNPPRLQIEVPAGTTTANVIADLNGLEVREIGRHRLELRTGDRLLGSAPFTVNMIFRQPQVANA